MVLILDHKSHKATRITKMKDIKLSETQMDELKNVFEVLKADQDEGKSCRVVVISLISNLCR